MPNCPQCGVDLTAKAHVLSYEEHDRIWEQQEAMRKEQASSAYLWAVLDSDVPTSVQGRPSSSEEK